jgi:CARDB
MRQLLIGCAAVAALLAAQTGAPSLAQQTPNPNKTPLPLQTPAPRQTPMPQQTPPAYGTPVPHQTPPSYGTPMPCRQITGALIRCPDLTARPPVSVGGHATHWGAGVTLTDADSLPGPRPYCAFDIIYTMANIGTAAAGPPAFPKFKNVLRVDGGAPVSIQSALSLAAGASQTIHTQAYLPMGVHQLSLDIDDGNVIPESNEANNHFAIKYQLTGKCKNRG